MNFIAHYHFTHKPGNAYHNLGIVLPDLTRNFIPSKRIKPETLRSILELDAHHQLNEGARQHYALDRFFHNSPFFINGYTFVKNCTANAQFDGTFSRYFFLNHIFLELMLDRYIISRHTPSIDGFYQSLTEVESEVLGSYLDLNGIETKELFLERFHQFREIRYLYHYTDNEKLIYSLNRIMMQVGLYGLSANNQQQLLPCIAETELWIDSEFPSLLQQFSEHNL